MANKKITDFSAAASLTGAELGELVQSGVNVKFTIQKLLEYVASSMFVSYTSGTPATPTFPNAPAVAYDPNGIEDTLIWDVPTQSWK